MVGCHMVNTVFKRKIYNEILEWKEKRSNKYALLIKGARRVGKSAIAEEFAKNHIYQADNGYLFPFWQYRSTIRFLMEYSN